MSYNSQRQWKIFPDYDCAFYINHPENGYRFSLTISHFAFRIWTLTLISTVMLNFFQQNNVASVWLHVYIICTLVIRRYSTMAAMHDVQHTSGITNHRNALIWYVYAVQKRETKPFSSPMLSRLSDKDKKEEIWPSPMTKAPTPTEMSKGQSDKQTTPQKSSIKQRLRTDLGRSVGVTTATQLVWLTWFTGPPSHSPQQPCTDGADDLLHFKVSFTLTE